MTPPRCPRVGAGSGSFETSSLRADLSRLSELPKESKARSASFVERTVVVVSDQIYPPTFTHPAPPGYGESLTFEIGEGRGGPDELIGLDSKTGADREVLLQVSSASHSDKTCRRKHRSRIADVKANSFFENPGRSEVISAAEKETGIAVNVLGGVVTDAKGRDQLLVGHPLFVDESVAPEARPEKASDARADRQGAEPVRIEVISIAGAEIHAGIAEFVLTVDLGAPGVLPLRDHSASVSACPVAESVGQSQIVAARFDIIGQQFRFD